MAATTYVLVSTSSVQPTPSGDYYRKVGIPASAVGPLPNGRRAVQYTSTSEMVADGWPANGPEVLAAERVFNPEPPPSEDNEPPLPQATHVVIIERTAETSQQSSGQITTYAAGQYTVFVLENAGAPNAVPVPVSAYNSPGGENPATVVTNLVANAIAGWTITDDGGGSFTVERDQVGIAFAMNLAVPQGAEYQPGAEAPANGIFNDLTEAWYWQAFQWVAVDVGEPLHRVHEAGRWADAGLTNRDGRRNSILCQVYDPDIPDGVVDNLGEQVMAPGYERLFGVFHNDASGLEKMSAAAIGSNVARPVQGPFASPWLLRRVNGSALEEDAFFRPTPTDNIIDTGLGLIERPQSRADAMVVSFVEPNGGGLFPIQAQAQDIWHREASQAILRLIRRGVTVDVDGFEAFADELDEVHTRLGSGEKPLLDLDTVTVTQASVEDIPADLRAKGDLATVPFMQVSFTLVPFARRFAMTAFIALA